MPTVHATFKSKDYTKLYKGNLGAPGGNIFYAAPPYESDLKIMFYKLQQEPFEK